jgi:hypothetical protein
MRKNKWLFSGIPALALLFGLTLAGCSNPSNSSDPGPGATYTVSYNGNGSTGGAVPVDNAAYENGNTVTVAGNTGSLTKTGHSFGGWNTKSEGWIRSSLT